MKLPFGKKNATRTTHGAHDVHDGQRDIGKPATAKGRSLLLLATLLGLASWLILVIGVALLQKRVHDRSYFAGTSNVNSYRDAFQSAHYTPYPDAHHRQWMLIWWIVAISCVTWLATLLLATRAARIIQWRPALIGFHIYVLVLCTFAIDAFLLLVHYDYHRTFFGKKRMDVALAGLFGLAIAHALAALALGLIANKLHLDNRHVNTGVRERIVEKEVPVPAARETHREETRMEDAAPVRVHTGGARVTDANPYPGRAEPVHVHQGGAVPHAGPKELGTRCF